MKKKDLFLVLPLFICGVNLMIYGIFYVHNLPEKEVKIFFEEDTSKYHDFIDCKERGGKVMFHYSLDVMNDEGRNTSTTIFKYPVMDNCIL
jgi:hypothetical protein